MSIYYLLRWWDSNPRPSGYEPDELPTALHRDFNERIANIASLSEYAKPN